MSKNNHDNNKVVELTEVQNMEPQENSEPEVDTEAQKTEEVKKCWITKVGESIDTGKRNRADKRAEKKAKKAEKAEERHRLSTGDKVLIGVGAAAVVRTLVGVGMTILEKHTTSAETETETEGEETEEYQDQAPTEE